MRPMRSLYVALLAGLLIASGSGQAQQVRRSDLQPLPEPPPMPEGAAQAAGDPASQPQVTVRRTGGDVIEEYRVGGRLVMIRVTPAHGVPYVLTDPRGDGLFTHRRDSLEAPPVVPMWVLFTF
jgi:hypothetical protein